MKVLIIAGKKNQKLVEAARKSFKETVEIDGLDYIENLGNYYLKGGIFDRAVIVEPGYTKDGETTDEYAIIDAIEKATNIVKKNSHSVMSMVYVANEEDIAFHIVEATSNISGEVVVIHNEKKKITTSLLTKLIMTDMAKFNRVLKTIDIGDLSKRAIDRAKENHDNIDFDSSEPEQTEIINDILGGGSDSNQLVFDGDIDDGWENDNSDTSDTSYTDENSDMHGYWNPIDTGGNLEGFNEDGGFTNPNDIDFSSDFDNTSNVGWGNGKDSLDIEEDIKSHESLKESLLGTEATEAGINEASELDEFTGTSELDEFTGTSELDEFAGANGFDSTEDFGGTEDFGTEDFGGTEDFSGTEDFGTEDFNNTEDFGFSGIGNEDNFDFTAGNSFGETEDSFNGAANSFGESEEINNTELNNSEFDGVGTDDTFDFNPNAEDFNFSTGITEEEFNSEVNTDFKDDKTFDEFTSIDNSQNDTNYSANQTEGFDTDFATETDDVFGFNTGSWNDEFTNDINDTSIENIKDTSKTEQIEQNNTNEGLSELYEDDWDTVETPDNNEIHDIAELYEENPIDSVSGVGGYEELDTSISDSEDLHKETKTNTDNENVNHRKRGLFKGNNSGGQKKSNEPRTKQSGTKQVSSNGLEKKLQNRLEMFKRKGNLMVVTGSNGTGKTTVASNIANLVCSYGLNVLVLDLDTIGRGQSYINYDNYVTVHSTSSDVNNVKLALNSNNNSFERFIHIIRPGYHILTGGLNCDKEDPEKVLSNKFINKFIHKAQTSYNMIIVDAPFDLITTTYVDMLTAADDVVLVEDLTNRGMINLLINLSNVVNDEAVDILFESSHILFNKDTNLDILLGKKVNDIHKALGLLDLKLKELSGIDTGLYFQNIDVCGIMKFNPKLERYWFSKKYFTDTPEGRNLFINILSRVYDLK